MRLVAKQNCWRHTSAERAAPLIDGAEYFSALANALEHAEHTVWIVGWDIHAFMRLNPVADPETSAETLRQKLIRLATARPELQIRILLWDFTVLYSPDRLPLPKAVLDWSMPSNVELRLDNKLPFGSSHHQKVVTIDSALGFLGGLDLTEGRWDTSDHAANEPRRCTGRGIPYAPFHDVQVAVAGDAAVVLAELCRDRWHACTGEKPEMTTSKSDLWPDSLEPFWTNIEVGIARTMPPEPDCEPIEEIRHLYVESIEAAQHSIYIENQYLTADAIADALAARLEEPDGPEVVIVTQASTHSWLEENTMGVRRARFLSRLADIASRDRLRVYAPRVPDVSDDEFKLHSKIMVVDDRSVQIGSANLNNRSMGLDSECDAVFVCRSESERAGARRFRNRLLAEHLGERIDTVEEEISAKGSLISAIECLQRGNRTLRELPVPDAPPEEKERFAELADLPCAPSKEEFLDRIMPDWEFDVDRRTWRSILKIGISILLVAGLALVWRWTRLSELVEPELAADLLSRAPDGPAAILLGVGVFVIGGIIVFPVTALIVATPLAFGPWVGFLTAVLGTYLSAIVTFAVGRKFGKKPFERWLNRIPNKISRRIAENGMLTVAFLRIVPIAPFSIINVLAGASTIKLRDFVIGTVFGMTPGIALLIAVGSRLDALLRDPSLIQILQLGVAIVLWLAAGFGLQSFARWLEKESMRSRAD